MCVTYSTSIAAAGTIKCGSLHLVSRQNFLALVWQSVRYCNSILISLLQPPTFDPDTTDDPNFYLVRFSRATGQDVRDFNISASQARMLLFNNLAKGTEYIVRIDVVNDVGNGTMFNSIQRQTLVDRKFLLILI
jgi:hypothetical protein